MRSEHAQTSATSRRRTVLTAVALLLCCFAIYWGVGRYYFVLDAYPNEILPDALFVHHSLTFDAYWNASQGDLPYFTAPVDGHVVSYYPIVPGLLNVPTYVVATTAGFPLSQYREAIAKTTAAWVTAASVACFYLFLIRLLPAAGSGPASRVALGFTLLYAFGTCVWSIGSQALWQHGPGLMFLTAALACLARPESRLFAVAGFMLGMAVWNRPVVGLLAGPLAAYVLVHQRRHLPMFAAGAAIPAIALAIYSQLYWGSLFALGQGHRLSGTFLGHHYDLNGPFFAGLAGVLASPARGLFAFTPVFLFAVPEVVRSLVHPRHPLLRYLAVGIVALIAFVANINVWWGGHSFGYRYLIETVPALTAMLAVGWAARTPVGIARWMREAVFCSLALAGLYIQFLGVLYFPCGWNASPVDVDRAPERLWDTCDTEIGRCQARLVGDAQSLLGGRSR